MIEETLTDRLARHCFDPDPTTYFRILADACENGELIALDVPARGEPARIWASPADIFDGAGMWEIAPNPVRPVPEYVAVSATRSALLAAEAKGMLEAAGFADEYVKTLLDGAAILKNNRNGGMATKLVEASTGYAELARRIRAAAAKLESGQ